MPRANRTRHWVILEPRISRGYTVGPFSTIKAKVTSKGHQHYAGFEGEYLARLWAANGGPLSKDNFLSALEHWEERAQQLNLEPESIFERWAQEDAISSSESVPFEVVPAPPEQVVQLTVAEQQADDLFRAHIRSLHL